MRWLAQSALKQAFRHGRGIATQAETKQQGWGKALLVAPPAILAGWIVFSDEPKRRARVAYNVPLRVFRDAVAVISITSGTSLTGQDFKIFVRLVTLVIWASLHSYAPRVAGSVQITSCRCGD